MDIIKNDAGLRTGTIDFTLTTHLKIKKITVDSYLEYMTGCYLTVCAGDYIAIGDSGVCVLTRQTVEGD